MKDEMNTKSLVTLDFLGQYVGLEVEINDGRIVDHTYMWDRTEAAK